MQRYIRNGGIVVFAVLVIFGVLYWIAQVNAQTAYQEAYELCLERDDFTDLDFSELRRQGYPEGFIQDVQACQDDGGCFLACASPCTPDSPFIAVGEMLDYLTPQVCPEVCVAKCLYPKDRYH